jgi:hypothetical protein
MHSIFQNVSRDEDFVDVVGMYDSTQVGLIIIQLDILHRYPEAGSVGSALLLL